MVCPLCPLIEEEIRSCHQLSICRHVCLPGGQLTSPLPAMLPTSYDAGAIPSHYMPAASSQCLLASD